MFERQMRLQMLSLDKFMFLKSQDLCDYGLPCEVCRIHCNNNQIQRAPWKTLHLLLRDSIRSAPDSSKVIIKGG